MSNVNFDYDRYDDDPANGGTYYGQDRNDGTTIWFDEDGNYDCVTDTPSDYDPSEYQHRVND